MENHYDSERRKYIRLDFQLKLNFTKEGEQKKGYQAVTRNISAEGLRFSSDQKLETGTNIDFEVQLPNRKKPTLFKGEVVWSRELPFSAGKQERSYDIGVRFVEIDKKDRNDLMLYICEKMVETLSTYLKLN